MLKDFCGYTLNAEVPATLYAGAIEKRGGGVLFQKSTETGRVAPGVNQVKRGRRTQEDLQPREHALHISLVHFCHVGNIIQILETDTFVHDVSQSMKGKE
jgi:hypothetical protein